MSLSVRVFWESEILEVTDHADYRNIAEAHFTSTVAKYRQSDSVDGGVTIQLIDGDEVLFETLVGE